MIHGVIFFDWLSLSITVGVRLQGGEEELDSSPATKHLQPDDTELRGPERARESPKPPESRLSPEQRQQHVIITQTGARSSKFQLHPLTESEPISAPEIILLILQQEFVAATCLTGGRPQGRPRTPSSGLGAPQILQEGPEVTLRRTSGVPAQPAATIISGG